MVFNFGVLNTSPERLFSAERLFVCLVKVYCCSHHVFAYYVLSFLCNSSVSVAGIFLFCLFLCKINFLPICLFCSVDVYVFGRSIVTNVSKLKYNDTD